MRYNKQPISINDQIAILKGRGLVFSDEQKAQTVLENISYFRLAGYWRTMEQNSSTHLFRTGSRFEDVVARYNFDSELKTLIFAAIRKRKSKAYVTKRWHVLAIINKNLPFTLYKRM